MTICRYYKKNGPNEPKNLQNWSDVGLVVEWEKDWDERKPPKNLDDHILELQKDKVKGTNTLNPGLPNLK